MTYEHFLVGNDITPHSSLLLKSIVEPVRLAILLQTKSNLDVFYRLPFPDKRLIILFSQDVFFKLVKLKPYETPV